MTKRRVYVNPKQQKFLDSKQRFRDFIGGVGSGKTGTIGHVNIDKFCYLPRAKSGLAALTYNQILNNSLPSMEKIWRLSGLREHTKHQAGHYVIGVKPPSNWVKPLDPPRRFEYVISFLNGYCIQLISLDRPDTIRGLNLDALDVDEKGWIKQEDFNSVLFPRVRGNTHSFNHPLHHAVMGFSSMPWSINGQWILKSEELAQEKPDKYFFVEATCKDNEAVLGKHYLEDARERVPDLIFRVEYLNERPKKVPNAFYAAFNEDTHTAYKTFDYTQTDGGLWTVAGNLDNDSKRPLELSFDFNAKFTSCIVCQDHGKEFRIINEFYVKESTTNLLDELLTKFISEYGTRENKDVFVYGDRNGNNKQVNDNQTFYEKIQRRLAAAGFRPAHMVRGLDPPHKKKYILINHLLSGTDPRTPRIVINKNRCKFLIISMQNANMIGDFEKDKSSERKAIEQERATHLSDCFDNIVYPKYIRHMDTETEHYEAKVA
jgi:hypothetical protein